MRSLQEVIKLEQEVKDRIEAIATVMKLDNLIVTITHSAIIVLNEIFQ